METIKVFNKITHQNIQAENKEGRSCDVSLSLLKKVLQVPKCPIAWVSWVYKCPSPISAQVLQCPPSARVPYMFECPLTAFKSTSRAWISNQMWHEQNAKHKDMSHVERKKRKKKKSGREGSKELNIEAVTKRWFEKFLKLF